MKRVFLTIGLLLLGSAQVQAKDMYSNPEKFRQFNPDGQKYQFARDYISSLKYLYANEQRDERLQATTLETFDKDKRSKMLQDNLNNQNVNLRVARNLLKRYQVSKNGLILKVVDLFVKSCDELIALNEKEKDLLDDIDAQENKPLPSQALASRFKRDQVHLALERKEASKKILKASVLLSKLLVSQKEDKHGEFVSLGITAQERKKLLEDLNSFSGEKYKGKMRQGQSALEGSVSAIRQILEDKSWGSLEKKS